MNEYDKHAQEVADKLGLKVAIHEAEKQTPPGWGKDSPHGIKYNVTLTKASGGKLRFPFWGSQYDMERGEDVSVYDVLACVASDLLSPQTADEVYNEYGEMKPSAAERIAKWSRELNAFFTPAEAEALAEIQ